MNPGEKDDDEEEEVEDKGEEGEDGPACPPPVPFWFNHLQGEKSMQEGV